MAEDWGIDVGVPDIGDRIEYKGDNYAVTGWMRERPKRKKLDERLEEQREWEILLDDVEYEAQQSVHGKKLEWCFRDEAQFVTYTGACGGVAPINEVKVIGKVNWPPEMLQRKREEAKIMAEDREILF